MNPIAMIWNRECRKTRHLLALWAGHDLDERDVAGIERHLAGCPHCREIRQELHRSQQVLEMARPLGVPDRQELSSVWLGVSRHIRSMDEQAISRGWRDWLPTGALAAVCVAMIAVLFPPVRLSDGRFAGNSVRVPIGTDVGNIRVAPGAWHPQPGSRHDPFRPVRATPAYADSYRNF